MHEKLLQSPPGACSAKSELCFPGWMASFENPRHPGQTLYARKPPRIGAIALESACFTRSIIAFIVNDHDFLTDILDSSSRIIL